MWKILAAFLLFAFAPLAAQAGCVVLLHGLARSETSLVVMELALGRQGYTVVNQGYPRPRHQSAIWWMWWGRAWRNARRGLCIS